MEENAFIGRIYKLTSTETDKVYVGSTASELKTRLQGHKRHYTTYSHGGFHFVSSFELLACADVNIELIYEGEFTCKKDMHVLEGQYIQATENSVK